VTDAGDGATLRTKRPLVADEECEGATERDTATAQIIATEAAALYCWSPAERKVSTQFKQLFSCKSGTKR